MQTRAIANDADVYVQPQHAKARMDGMPDEILNIFPYVPDDGVAKMMRTSIRFKNVAEQCLYADMGLAMPNPKENYQAVVENTRLSNHMRSLFLSDGDLDRSIGRKSRSYNRQTRSASSGLSTLPGVTMGV
jgi:hypothetical protein